MSLTRAPAPPVRPRPAEEPLTGDKSVDDLNQFDLDLKDGNAVPDGQRWVKLYEPRPQQFNTKLEQWVFYDLILRAQWRATTITFKKRQHRLKRGQLIIVVTSYAQECGMSRKSMRTILARLVDHDRIQMGPSPGQAATLISIENYDLYQGRSAPKGQDRAKTGPTEQVSKNIEEEGVARARPGRRLSDEWKPDEEEVAYAIERGIDEAHLRDVAEDFRTYFTAGPGRNKTYSNWRQAWQGWVRREVNRPSVNGRPVNGKPRDRKRGDGSLATAIRRNLV